MAIQPQRSFSRPTNSRKPFDDVRVRRAMAHAIDRSALIKGAMSGYGVPIGSHMDPGNPYYIDLTIILSL